MTDLKAIKSTDYTYELPQNRIALYPLQKRDESKLLVYKNGNISSDIFKNITRYIPENSIIILNNTKVVNARIYFKKNTGARIEIFCLEPEKGLSHLEAAYTEKGSSVWKCLIGKAGKWKSGQSLQTSLLKNGEYTLEAKITGKGKDFFLIEFKWKPQELSFLEILHLFGITPLPPYIKREAERSDESTYQTIYAEHDGSVAAPTSGFHFTDETLNSLKNKKIETKFLTLHIGAGTFKPVTSDTIGEHNMHPEKIIINKNLIECLYLNLKTSNTENYKTVIMGGTTSTRALESFYWFALSLMNDFKEELLINGFNVSQWLPYENKYEKLKECEPFEFILDKMTKYNLDEIFGETSLIIVPGYKFKVTDALITNFHLPGSTLLLLVAALTGNNWREIYNYALENEFRFLSYGDSSILFKNKEV
jgi:S-adenosylmethionine:tRNA ribosyltransferase-isomerase